MKDKLLRFTLVEMLIVVAVILILVAILLPAIYQAEFFAQLSLCKSNLRQQVAGTTNYAIDYKRMYPDGGAQGHGGGGIGAFMLGRTCWWNYPNYPYTTAWASYYSNPKFGNYKDLTFRNDLFRCPRGMDEGMFDPDTGAGNHCNSATYYAHANNAYHGQSSRTFHDGVQQPYVYSNPERVMRKLGGKWTISPFHWWTGGGMSWKDQSVEGLRYDIMGMDIGIRGGGNDPTTNHVWGGSRVKTGHSSYVPVGWYSIGGRPTINYSMADGSARSFQLPNNGSYRWRRFMHITNGFGFATAGSSHLIPKEWGTDEYDKSTLW